VLKAACALYLIVFFFWVEYWGSKMLQRLTSMSKRTNVTPKTLRFSKGGGSHNKSRMSSSSQHGGATESGSSSLGESHAGSSSDGSGPLDKRSACIKRFRNFLIYEAIVAFIAIGEHAVSTVLKEQGYLSLEKDPELVLLAKILQRGTEFVMMTLLAYLVCLKSSSKNFTINNRLPTLTVPGLCKGSGWCASRPVQLPVQDERESSFGSATSLESFESDLEAQRISNNMRSQVDANLKKKKQHADQRGKDVVEFEKRTKRKKGFGKVKRPNKAPLRPKMNLELATMSNPAPVLLGQSGGTRAKSSSIFEATNPIARKIGKEKPPAKRKSSTKGVNRSLPPAPTQL